MLFLLRVLLQLIYVPTASMETTIPTRSLVVGWRLPHAVADPVPSGALSLRSGTTRRVRCW